MEIDQPNKQGQETGRSRSASPESSAFKKSRVGRSPLRPGPMENTGSNTNSEDAGIGQEPKEDRNSEDVKICEEPNESKVTTDSPSAESPKKANQKILRSRQRRLLKYLPKNCSLEELKASLHLPTHTVLPRCSAAGGPGWTSMKGQATSREQKSIQIT